MRYATSALRRHKTPCGDGIEYMCCYLLPLMSSRPSVILLHNIFSNKRVGAEYHDWAKVAKPVLVLSQFLILFLSPPLLSSRQGICDIFNVVDLYKLRSVTLHAVPHAPLAKNSRDAVVEQLVCHSFSTMFATLLAVLVLTVLGYIINTISKPKKFPPGPKWYPFVGSSAIAQKVTLQYGSQWKGFSHLAKEYSTQVLGLKLGTELVVVVYGEKNIRTVFTEKEYEGRPDSFFIRLRCLGKRLGITFVDGPLWKEHRQFTVKNLKNVGFGKTMMEKEIQNELQHVLEYIDNNRAKAINPKSILAMSVMNILWRYTAGEKIKDEKLQYIIDLFSKRSKAFSITGGWLNQYPWMRFIFPDLSGYTLIKNLNKKISDIIEESVSKHKNGSIPGSDFIYKFLEEMEENNLSFHEEQLKAVCLDILIAGSQTTSNVLEFAILSLIRYPAVQQKVYDEIHTTIGDDTPCWNDTNRLVYTMAFLLEVQRFYTIAPLAGPRRVLEETTIEDYVIPKNTTILISIGDLHYDPDIWDEPNKFMPERFLGADGKIINTEHFYGFGLGRRRCPGDSLAKSFIFIILVGIVQKYRLECTNGVLPPEEPFIGLIAGARPFTAEFIARC